MVDPARQFELERFDQRKRIRLIHNRNVQLGKDRPDVDPPTIREQVRRGVTQQGIVAVDFGTVVMLGQEVAAYGGA